MKKQKIKSFTDLTVWEKGHLLVLSIYKVTSKFPKKETYSLVDQMRRAAVSVTSNIAEGFSRKTAKEKIRFYYLALGSLTELQNQILIAKDVDYLNEKKFKYLANRTVVVNKLINGSIKKLSAQND
jgi:four helix bundle protein